MRDVMWRQQPLPGEIMEEIFSTLHDTLYMGQKMSTRVPSANWNLVCSVEGRKTFKANGEDRTDFAD